VDECGQACGGNDGWQAAGERAVVATAGGGDSRLGTRCAWTRAKMGLGKVVCGLDVGRIGLPSLLRPTLGHSKLLELGTGGHRRKNCWARKRPNVLRPCFDPSKLC
jgi:hypothetical protein